MTLKKKQLNNKDPDPAGVELIRPAQRRTTRSTAILQTQEQSNCNTPHQGLITHFFQASGGPTDTPASPLEGVRGNVETTFKLLGPLEDNKDQGGHHCREPAATQKIGSPENIPKTAAKAKNPLQITAEI